MANGRSNKRQPIMAHHEGSQLACRVWEEQVPCQEVARNLRDKPPAKVFRAFVVAPFDWRCVPGPLQVMVDEKAARENRDNCTESTKTGREPWFFLFSLELVSRYQGAGGIVVIRMWWRHPPPGDIPPPKISRKRTKNLKGFL